MNYQKIIDDFKSGKLDKSKHELTMDNDTCYLSSIDPTLSEEENDEMYFKLKDEYGTGEGYGDIVKIFQAAGVNSDWC